MGWGMGIEIDEQFDNRQKSMSLPGIRTVFHFWVVCEYLGTKTLSCVCICIFIYFFVAVSLKKKKRKIKCVHVFPPFSHLIQCGLENIRRAESLNGNPLFSKVSLLLQPF